MAGETPAAPPASDDGAARFARGARRVSALTMLSRLLGLVREQVFAITLGAGIYSDAFLAAFRIPNLLRDLFAEGALSAAFVPVFIRQLATGERQNAWRLGNNIINLRALGPFAEAMSQLGYSLEEIEEREHDAGLGNGGLGRRRFDCAVSS